MGITVNWNGTDTVITGSNAYAIYQDYVEGDIDDMSSAAINACKNYLSDEEVEEIEENYYNSEEGGAAELGEDAENAENSSGQGANVTGSVAVSGGSTAIGILFGEVAKNQMKVDEENAMLNSYLALAAGGIATAMALSTLAAAKMFDSDYDARNQAESNSDNTNSILEEHANELIESQESMNDDMDAYSEASEEYTLTVNENTSNKANLEAQLKACQASGDTAGAASIQSQLDSLAEESEETTTEGINEIQENMTEYQNMAATSIGAAGAGQEISDFLKPGTALGVVATVNAVALSVTTILSGVCATKSLASAKSWWDVPAACAASVLFIAATVGFASSAAWMAKKAKNEYECGSAGKDMQGYVNTLNDEIANQSEYMDFTNETYGEVDEASAESQANASEAAGEVLANNGITTTDDEDEDLETKN